MDPVAKSLEEVRAYYGAAIQSAKDLQTSTCCCTAPIPAMHRAILDLIDDEVISRFYGCGSPIPSGLEDCTVLDLGCGSGRDTYLVSALVGEQGSVIGVDMTTEQLKVAQQHRSTQAQRFGFAKSNVTFHQGYIEDLASIGIADASVDVVISNCVINLSPDKARVFAEIFRVLKPGGELFFSDVFASRRVPAALQSDPVLHGECLAGALYVEDFRRLMRAAGWPDFRVVSRHRIEMNNPDVEARVGMIDFFSMTIRAFKLPGLEDICEDYGQVAYYLGTLPGHPHRFELDDHHTFITDKPMLVCGNTAAMVSETRFAPHFQVIGNRDIHFGVFDCASPAAVVECGGCC